LSSRANDWLFFIFGLDVENFAKILNFLFFLAIDFRLKNLMRFPKVEIISYKRKLVIVSTKIFGLRFTKLCYLSFLLYQTYSYWKLTPLSPQQIVPDNLVSWYTQTKLIFNFTLNAIFISNRIDLESRVEIHRLWNSTSDWILDIWILEPFNILTFSSSVFKWLWPINNQIFKRMLTSLDHFFYKFWPLGLYYSMLQ
jgi:hypothetical protein